MKGFKPSCRIKPNAAGDWQVLPPAGQITQIGDAGVTSEGLVSNDDLFVSGSMEVRDLLSVIGLTTVYDDIASIANMTFFGPADEATFYAKATEEVTIPVGQGAAGILSAANLCPAHSVILGVVGRVTQSPGGGATLFDIGRNPIGPAEFGDNVAVALGTQFVSPTDGDGSNVGPVHNAADKKLKITTNANVTGTDMKVRVTVFYVEMFPPES